MQKSYFSISTDWPFVNTSIAPFDFFINSSAKSDSPHFVRILAEKDEVNKEVLQNLKKKYGQVYLEELSRLKYLNLFMVEGNFSVEAKGEMIKKSAIQYLENLFSLGGNVDEGHLAENIKSCREVVEHLVDTIKDYSLDKIHQLIGALSFHDFYTFDHSVNVCMYCIYMHKQLYPDAEKADLVTAGLGGLLHDLGKIKVPTNIINKPDKLTEEEFQFIKRHPQDGVDLFKNFDASSLEGIDLDRLKRVIFQHHENFDGKGYPKGVSGIQIDVLARVTAMADFFDAITTKRSYNQVLSLNEALSLMENTKGKKLDPMLFNLFAQTIQDFRFGVGNQTIEEGFDCCVPHRTLPLIDYKRDEAKDFGNVHVDNQTGISKKLQKMRSKK